MRKIIWVGLLILVFSISVQAAKVEPKFNEINLYTTVTNYTWPPVETKTIEGVFEIEIKGVGNKCALEISFLAGDPEVYRLMGGQLEIQYCVASTETTGQWSEWKYLNQLPLTIDLREVRSLLIDPIKNNASPAQVVLMLRFRVPQSVQLRHGVYEGEFCLQVS